METVKFYIETDDMYPVYTVTKNKYNHVVPAFEFPLDFEEKYLKAWSDWTDVQDQLKEMVETWYKENT